MCAVISSSSMLPIQCHVCPHYPHTFISYRRGSVSVAILLVYYVIPLSTMVTIVRHKDASSIYLPLAAAAILNGGMWTIYGLVRQMQCLFPLRWEIPSPPRGGSLRPTLILPTLQSTTYFGRMRVPTSFLGSGLPCVDTCPELHPPLPLFCRDQGQHSAALHCLCSHATRPTISIQRLPPSSPLPPQAVGDINIWGPNSFGVVIGCVQVGLRLFYGVKKQPSG